MSDGMGRVRAGAVPPVGITERNGAARRLASTAALVTLAALALVLSSVAGSRSLAETASSVAAAAAGPAPLAAAPASGTATPDEDEVAVHSTAMPSSPEDSDPNKVKIRFYMESQCPACRKLSGTYLKQVLEAPGMDAILDFKFVPWGNGRVVDPETQDPVKDVDMASAKESFASGSKLFHFIGQHGPTEMQGNSWESCVQHLYPQQTQFFPVIECIEHRSCAEDMEPPACQGPPAEVAEDCVNDKGPFMDRAKLHSCVQGKLGATLLMDNAVATTASGAEWVPWFTVDDKPLVEDAAADGAFKNTFLLGASVCKRYAEKTGAALPASCETFPDSVDQIPKDPFSLFQEGTTDGESTSLSKASPNLKIPVRLYMESRCPSCKAFITTYVQQLLQTPGIKDIVDFKLVPWGFAKLERTANGAVVEDAEHLWEASQALSEVEFSSEFNFTCQHGEHECRGNMWESCIQSLYPEIAFPSIHCIEQLSCEEGKAPPNCSGYPDEVAHQCVMAHGKGMNPILLQDCMEGPRGRALMATNAFETARLDPKPTWVPWITVDGTAIVSNSSDDSQYTRMFTIGHLVCRAYQNKTGLAPPRACGSFPSLAPADPYGAFFADEQASESTTWWILVGLVVIACGIVLVVYQLFVTHYGFQKGAGAEGRERAGLLAERDGGVEGAGGEYV